MSDKNRTHNITRETTRNGHTTTHTGRLTGTDKDINDYKNDFNKQDGCKITNDEIVETRKTDIPFFKRK